MLHFPQMRSTRTLDSACGSSWEFDLTVPVCDAGPSTITNIESEGDWRVAFEGAGSDLRSPSPLPSQRSSSSSSSSAIRGPSPRRRESPMRRDSPTMRASSPQPLRSPRYVNIGNGYGNGYGYDDTDDGGSSRRGAPGRLPPPLPSLYRP